MLYFFLNFVISFKSLYIRRVHYKIWQVIPKLATQISKTISVYLFVHRWKRNVHLTSISGVMAMDIKVHIYSIRIVVRCDSMEGFKH